MDKKLIKTVTPVLCMQKMQFHKKDEWAITGIFFGMFKLIF